MKGKRDKSLGTSLLDIFRSIRKDVPKPSAAIHPKRGKGHEYSKKDRSSWKREQKSDDIF